MVVINGEKQDLRVVRTKKSIEDSFFIALSEQNFEDITVSDICRRAMVKRATFYSHFQDKNQLLIYCIKNLFKRVNFKDLRHFDLADSLQYYDETFELLYEFLEKNRSKLYAVTKSTSNSMIVDTCRKLLAADLAEKIDKWVAENRPICMPSQIIAECFAGAVVSLALGWIQGDFDCTKEEMKKYLGIVVEKLQINRF